MVISRPARSSSDSSSASSLRWLAASLVTLYLVCALMSRALAHLDSPELVAAAITFDLTITASALVWWLGSRRGLLPRWAPLGVLSLGVSLATRLPYAPLGAGRVLAAAGILVEAAVLTSLALRLPPVVRAFLAARPAGPVGALEAALLAARLPARLAAVTAAELAVLSLLLTGWVRRPDKAAFSMRRTGWISMAGVFGFLVAVESLAVHLALATFCPLAAWLATASSAYVLAWLVADCHAIRLYPVAIAGDALWVRLGVRWRGRIPLADIARVTRISAVPEDGPGGTRAADLVSLALLEPTVLVELVRPAELHGPLGKRRLASRIALTLDDPDRFERSLAAARPVA